MISIQAVAVRVEAMLSESVPVIAGHDNQGILEQASLAERIEQRSQLGIEIQHGLVVGVDAGRSFLW